LVTASAIDKSTAVDWLARFGYAARGVVYLVVGYFALLAALGSGATKDTEDVFSVVLSQPFGQVLLFVLVAGLFAFGLWRMAQAFLDADDRGGDAKGFAVRAGKFISGLVHFALAATALGLIVSWGDMGMESGSGGSGDPTGAIIVSAVEQGWGRIALYLIAAVPVVIGVAQLVKAWRCSYERRFVCDQEMMDRVRPVARAGLAARGISFLIIGGLIFWGGLSYVADKTPGVKDALDALRAAPYGWILLGLMGVGLIAFAAYCFAQAAYRRVNV
jgi:hypothetical protein